MNDSDIKPHGVAQSIALHLLPGLPQVLLYWATVDAVVGAGFPRALVWGVLVNVCALLPILLGVLYLAAHRSGVPLRDLLVYRARLKWWHSAVWVIAILVPTAAIFAGLSGVTSTLRPLFSYWPVDVGGAYEGSFARSVLLVTAMLNFSMTAVAVPLVEELYFRGYLLPRMPRAFGRAGPVVHSFLFAIYHFAEPWIVPVRTLGLLPLIFVTRYTRSLVPGVVSHGLVNMSGVIESVLQR